MSNLYAQIDHNKRTSALVITGFIAFILTATYLISYAFEMGPGMIGIAFIAGGLGSFISYYFSDRIILSISNAEPANRDDHFDFYTASENLCMAARIPMPKLYVIRDTAMNAFATGRDPNHAVVCITTGLLTKLDRTELEGVIAHELAHIKNYDIRLMSIVSILVGTITLLADWLLRMSMFGHSDRKNNQAGPIVLLLGMALVILSPIIATIIKLAISRRREFLADASAAEMTRFPEGLKRALLKISNDKEPLESANKATAHLYIANPLKNHHDSIGWFANLFSTHPPIKDRIAALEAIS